MKKNVGDIDAYMRITTGLTMLGYGIVKESKKSMIIGSMKVAEGITRFCPMFYIMGLSSNNDSMTFEVIKK